MWGLGIQFILGVVILQTSWGFAAFRFLGKEIQTFLSYTDVGAKFVFGESYMHHFFAFKVSILVNDTFRLAHYFSFKNVCIIALKE